MKTKKYIMSAYINIHHNNSLESFALEWNLSCDDISSMYEQAAQYMIVIEGSVKYLAKIKRAIPNREESI